MSDDPQMAVVRTVYRRRKAFGQTIRSRELVAYLPAWYDDLPRLRALIRAGETCDSIGKRFGISRQAVARKLSRLGLRTLSPKGRRSPAVPA